MTDDDFDPCPADKDGVLDIGHGVRIRLFTADDIDGSAGLIESHPTPAGGRCSGAIHFARTTTSGAQAWPEDVTWKVEQEDPLTLSPSLLCRVCGHHGWIRSGRWVPA